VRRRNATTIRGPVHIPVAAGPEPARPAPGALAARA
jgi:hypothetical protein